jgi:hypothetical protein
LEFWLAAKHKPPFGRIFYLGQSIRTDKALAGVTEIGNLVEMQKIDNQ